MKQHTFAPLKKSSLPGPDDITRVQLPNGITILVRPNFNSMSVSISGYLHAGSLYEPLEKLGLADFTATCLTRGTERYTFKEIYDKLESIGASFGFSSGTHTAGFGGKSLANDLDTLLEILASGLREPTFPAQPVEIIRSQFLTSLALRAQDTGEMSSILFDEIIYEGHPYSYPTDGNPETIQAIQRDDLADFHARHYGPRGMVIAVVGAVTPDDAIRRISETLGDWANPQQPEEATVPPVHPLKRTIAKHISIPEKSQTDIIMGVVGPPRRSPDYMPAKVGNSVLGQFGMMGRIGNTVRSKAGLAYYAYSAVSSSIGPGAWYVSAGVNPLNTEKVIKLIKAEVKRFIQEPVSAEELSNSQSSYIGKLPLALESNAGVAEALLSLERYDLGLDYYHHYEETIREVTPQSVLNVAQKYLDLDRFAIATAGSGVGD
ncbi:MAG: insulinase family protein [Chloroflexota bacterium]|nr:MAG: insulinase family protein [Chloroflexota bacterium]